MFKHGLMIGKFWPFHYGHESTINKGLEQSENLTILVGSIGNIDAPFTPDKVFEMVNNVFPPDLFKKLKVFGVPDIGNNDWWTRYILMAVKAFRPDLPKPDAYFCGSHFDARFFRHDIHHIVINDRREAPVGMTGRTIREMCEYGDERWKQLVPECNHNIVTELQTKLMWRSK